MGFLSLEEAPNPFANQNWFNLSKVYCVMQSSMFDCGHTCNLYVTTILALIARSIQLLPPALVTGDINGEEGGEQAGGHVFCGCKKTCCPKPRDRPQNVLQRTEEEKYLSWPPCAEGTGCYLVGLVGW